MKKVAAAGLFAALALALNFPLLGIPNIEVFSLILFISGIFLGWWGGIVVPLIAGSIFVFFNPNGPPTLVTLIIAQLAGFIMIGLAGATFGRSVIKNKNRVIGITFCAAIGVVVTFIYDALSNLALATAFGPFWPIMTAGIAFSLWHMVSNGLIFGFSEPIIVKLWQIVGSRLA